MNRFMFVVGLSFFLLSSCVYHDLSNLNNCKQSDLQLILDSVRSVSDCALQDGALYVEASGGANPYAFYLNGVLQSGANVENIKAGIYTVSVRDGNGCEVQLNNISVGAKGFSFKADVQPDNSCLSNSGSISITVTEGHPPYQYQLEGGEFTESGSFANLSSGNYNLAVKDNLGCVYEFSVEVPDGPTGVSWNNYIKPIMQTSCAIPRCHNGVSRPDLRIYSNAKFYASSIKSMTVDGSMPQDGKLTQDQINLISCWVNDGAPDN